MLISWNQGRTPPVVTLLERELGSSAVYDESGRDQPAGAKQERNYVLVLLFDQVYRKIYQHLLL